MDSANLNCWRCGEALADVLLPLSRLSKCKCCNADLHVCHMCEFFDPTVNNSCREPVAEKVTIKIRANFCGYLKPSANAFKSSDSDSQVVAKNQLDELFGLNDKQEVKDINPDSLEDLFSMKKNPSREGEN